MARELENKKGGKEKKKIKRPPETTPTQPQTGVIDEPPETESSPAEAEEAGPAESATGNQQPEETENDGGKVTEFEENQQPEKKFEAGGGARPEPSQDEPTEPKNSFQAGGGQGYNPQLGVNPQSGQQAEDQVSDNQKQDEPSDGASTQAKLEDEWAKKSILQKRALLKKSSAERVGGIQDAAAKNGIPDSVGSIPSGPWEIIKKRLPKLFSPEVFVSTLSRVMIYLAGDWTLIPMLDGYLGEETTDKFILGVDGYWCCVNCCGPIVLLMILIGIIMEAADTLTNLVK